MQQRKTRIGRGKPASLALCALVLMIAAGCEDGLQQGMNDGISAAVSAIIQAPVNYMLDQAFSEP
ncbi:MAG: hypothetical protein JSV19_08950 [Phycisphaerales bacterium]|nr:MAG: hypothetical protein JSV19_08950 [Phycisphaerales bacterium]